MAQSKSIELSDGSKVYVQAKGLKLTTRGKVMDPKDAIANLSKGDRRRVRRGLDKMGRQDLSKASL